jgi:hypothetical protein
MIDLDQPPRTGRRHPWWVFSNTGVLATMACAVVLAAAAGGAVASYAWTASHADGPAGGVSAFAEVPVEFTNSKSGATARLTGHISVVNAEPRTVRINSLKAEESGLRLYSLPPPSGASPNDIPPNGAVSIAVALDLQCTSEAPLSDISLTLDAYAMEGNDVLGVPKSASLSILPWRDTINTIKSVCMIS